ncbi:hypothetical protein OEZ85_000501 [Tetradesmus obliquus]|uniref:Uncharacterized protein n=1 Tax=Tetradesmus obliquus TaxID=3088 RepID=A0ABY8UJ46_TETOB|nr:hypothetical protein OEZ85_000501 [Tetradesmus obliquus]
MLRVATANKSDGVWFWGVPPSSPFRTAGARDARGGPQETQPAPQHTPLADGTRRRRRSRDCPDRHAPAGYTGFAVHV